ncbi:MAG: right-handed parallel beta-helix repeat-containing protein [Pirellulaceae bacterium]|nr:right-handed parallel beta-helix repeat-containing protein [Pirellulaceae bacterium]
MPFRSSNTMTVVAALWLSSCLFTLSLAQAPRSELFAELARVADGQTDAAPILQKLIDSRPGHLQLPPGTYRLERTVDIDLAQTGYLSLTGSSASQLVMSGAGPALRFKGSHFKSADPPGFSEQVWDQERMPVVKGIAIRGEHPAAVGIEATGTMQLTISQVHLRQLQHGVHLLNNNRNVLIDACHIYENHGIGVFYDQVNLHQSNIIGCHISYCDQGGIVSRGGNVRNIHIVGCDLESNMSADQPPTANVFIDCRGSAYGTAEVAISGCTIQHNNDGPESANIRIIGLSNPSPTAGKVQEGNITISGNVLSDVQTNIWLESCRGVTMTGNTCWMGFEHNLLIEDCSHIVMAANNFDRNPRYDYGVAKAAKNQILIRNSRDCTLTGLHVSQVFDIPAVLFENCDRFNVSGLTILDCDLGLQLTDVTRSVFSGCLIDDSRAGSKSRKVVVESSDNNRFDFPLE